VLASWCWLLVRHLLVARSRSLVVVLRWVVLLVRWALLWAVVRAVLVVVGA
jgi:hypothetical protein